MASEAKERALRLAHNFVRDKGLPIVREKNKLKEGHGILLMCSLGTKEVPVGS